MRDDSSCECLGTAETPNDHALVSPSPALAPIARPHDDAETCDARRGASVRTVASASARENGAIDGLHSQHALFSAARHFSARRRRARRA